MIALNEARKGGSLDWPGAAASGPFGIALSSLHRAPWPTGARGPARVFRAAGAGGFSRSSASADVWGFIHPEGASAKRATRPAGTGEESRPLSFVASILAGMFAISSRVDGPMNGHGMGIGRGGDPCGSSNVSRSNCFASSMSPSPSVLSEMSTWRFAWSDNTIRNRSKNR